MVGLGRDMVVRVWKCSKVRWGYGCASRGGEAGLAQYMIGKCRVRLGVKLSRGEVYGCAGQDV